MEVEGNAMPLFKMVKVSRSITANVICITFKSLLCLAAKRLNLVQVRVLLSAFL